MKVKILNAECVEQWIELPLELRTSLVNPPQIELVCTIPFRGEGSVTGYELAVRTNGDEGAQAEILSERLTVNRAYELPDASGEIALKSDINISFTTVDGKTITVTNGIVTDITE